MITPMRIDVLPPEQMEADRVLLEALTNDALHGADVQRVVKRLVASTAHFIAEAERLDGEAHGQYVRCQELVKLIHEQCDRVGIPEGLETFKPLMPQQRLTLLADQVIHAPPPADDFQTRAAVWCRACVGHQDAADKVERGHRFLEEALELVQAGGITRDAAYDLVDYVYGRPVGEVQQEVGGVMLTLAAMASAHEVDLGNAAEYELARVQAKIDVIRAKHNAKPRGQALPGVTVEGAAEYHAGQLDRAMGRLHRKLRDRVRGGELQIDRDYHPDVYRQFVVAEWHMRWGDDVMRFSYQTAAPRLMEMKCGVDLAVDTAAEGIAIALLTGVRNRGGDTARQFAEHGGPG